MSAVRIAAGPGDDLAALVRAARGESVLVMLSPGLDPLTLARARAAVGPLAIERAPGTRVNAVLATVDAAREDVESAASFLERARSTTGQMLEVGPR